MSDADREQELEPEAVHLESAGTYGEATIGADSDSVDGEDAELE